MAKKSIEETVARMDWGEVRQTLKNIKTATRGSAPASPEEEKLRQYFGEKRFRDLSFLSLFADKTKRELGNVVLLPGIMGSHLSVTDKEGSDDLVWFSLWQIIRGNMKRLQLAADGKKNAND